MHQYRRSAMLLVAAVMIAALAAGTATAQNLSFKAVKDPQNRFTIDVPASWSVTTQSKNPAVEAKSSASGATLPDSLDVTVYDWARPISAHDCISESDIVLRYAIHNWSTVKEGPVVIAGQPGYSRVYNWKTNSGEPRQSVEVCVTHANRVYVAVGTTENVPAKVTTTMPLLERAIATLQPNFANVPGPAEPARFGGNKN